jgi:hypothetical protein
MFLDMISNFDVVSRVLFPTPDPSYGPDDFPEELVFIPRSLDPSTEGSDDCVPCLLLLSPSARYVVLYLHSNAEDLGQCYTFCSVVRSQFQVNVLAVEYPGYGICGGGQATEDGVISNVCLAFEFLRKVLGWQFDEIIIFGRSIGCGPALALAEEASIYGLILVCPFISVKEIARIHVGPLAQFIDERFPNKDRIARVNSRLLLIHGKKDTVVPCWHGEALFKECRAPKHMVSPTEMEHNTNLLVDATYFVLPTLQFFDLPDYRFEPLRVPSWVYEKRMENRSGDKSKATTASASSSRAALKNALGALPSVEVRPDKDGKSYIAWNRAPNTQAPALHETTESTSDEVDIDVPENFLEGFNPAAQSVDDEDDELNFDEELPDAPDDVGYWKAPPSAAGVQPLNGYGPHATLV